MALEGGWCGKVSMLDTRVGLFVFSVRLDIVRKGVRV